MVMTTQGSMTPAMGAVLHSIAEAVATVEGSDPIAVRLDLFERLAIAVARANSQAIARRRVRRTDCQAAAHRYIAAAAAILEDPPD